MAGKPKLGSGEGGVSVPEGRKPLPRVDRDLALTRSLRQNHGVMTLDGLQRFGFTEKEIRGLVSHGDLRRLHRGVYADGRSPLSDPAILRAALLAGGQRCWLSGQAAAMGWGLTPLSVPRLEVTLVARSTPASRPSLRVRSVRTAPHHSEVRTRSGLRLSSIPRLLIESAAHGAGGDQLQTLIEAAVRRNLLDIDDLATTLARAAGQRGTREVRRTCKEYLPDINRKSWLERAFDRWLARHPEIPPPQRNVKLGQWEIDCFWPDHCLALELDGRSYHTLVEEIERDRRKDAWLQAQGQLILRVTHSRFRLDKPGIHRDLTSMLALGAARQPGGRLAA